MATSAGSLTFILLATSPIALMKRADQPAAYNCCGLVRVPGTPGAENLASKRRSSLRETPPRRPPKVWVLAVYRTFMSSWIEPATAFFFDQSSSYFSPCAGQNRQGVVNESFIP